MTSGIVSAVGRSGLGIEGYEGFIQTDASINPGNSGGALVTLDGRLVGISTAILSKTGASNGIGFAIPIDMARRVMQQILAHREVQRGRIGMMLKEPSGDKGRKGAEIAAIEPNSPADVAGLEKGDVIVAVDGRAVKSPAQLRNLVGLTPAGREIGVRFRRGSGFGNASVRVAAARRA